MSGKRELDQAVRALDDADTLAFGGVGFAGQVLPATEAYRVLEQELREQPEAARKRVERLLKKGTPAGKAYAATLLEAVDPAAGRDAWERLRGDDGEFTTFSGCVMGRTTLGEYAAERLADG
ncbi:hypothetical protein [Micromonospora humi]|uniref:Uncharacterized protein n=1 Tax=Micromonospora humi TaxID=745366 RepID=A0A1C5IDV0_9ACTN|nr:hypothetical protein [Micromonospora humi]SCG56530.1 hypothetical protein GA0070213_105348 [Micromonospora humi]